MAQIVRDPDDPITVTPQRAAALSGLSVATIRRYVGLGKLVAKKTERRVLISFASLLELLTDDASPQQAPKAKAATAPIRTKRPGPNWDALKAVR